MILLTDSKKEENIVNFKNISKSCLKNEVGQKIWQIIGLLFFIL